MIDLNKIAESVRDSSRLRAKKGQFVVYVCVMICVHNAKHWRAVEQYSNSVLKRHERRHLAKQNCRMNSVVDV